MTLARWFADDYAVNRVAVVEATADHLAWGQRLKAAGPMRLEAGSGSLFHVPVYRAKDATTRAVLTQFAWAAAQQTMGIAASGNVLFGTYQPGMVPWNPAWAWPATSQPTDRTIVIVDDATGQVWELWKVGNDDGTLHGYDAGLHVPNWFAANYADSHGLPWITVADARTWKSIWTRTDDPKHIGIRGCGLDKPAGIVRAAEVADGMIRHAINMTISNTRIGSVFRRPATRSELTTLALGQAGGVVTTVRPDAETLPSGTRLVLVLDSATQADLYARCGLADPTKRTVDVLLNAMRTHGCVSTETGGYGVAIEADWSSATSAQWAALGVVSAAGTQPYQRVLAELTQHPEWWRLACEMP